jgi:hypothetical protein
VVYLKTLHTLTLFLEYNFFFHLYLKKKNLWASANTRYSKFSCSYFIRRLIWSQWYVVGMPEDSLRFILNFRIRPIHPVRNMDIVLIQAMWWGQPYLTIVDSALQHLTWRPQQVLVHIKRRKKEMEVVGIINNFHIWSKPF